MTKQTCYYFFKNNVIKYNIIFNMHLKQNTRNFVRVILYGYKEHLGKIMDHIQEEGSTER